MKLCEECNAEFSSIDCRTKFCSRTCSTTANNKKRHINGWKLSTESKCKISTGVRKNGYRRPRKQISLTCVQCQTTFNTWPSHKRRLYCSKKCRGQDKSLYQNCGGVRKGSGRSKSGWYNEIYCGSTYELAWVIWMLEHNQPFIRNTEGFDYVYNDSMHKYYPDFIVNGKYVEIKGYEIEKDTYKWKMFPHPLIVLKKKDLKEMLDYAKQKYGNDLALLYVH